jgi:phage terminase large subunit-like protein
MAAPRKPGDYVREATQYAEDVVSGKIAACLYVRQACERQLRDLKRTDWAFTFDVRSAERVCKFAELLPHTKGPLAGTLLRLEPWQSFILTTVFGWLKPNGKRRFRRTYAEVPRGNGKTSVSVAPALYMLAADGDGGAEVYSAARTRDQAKIPFAMGQQIVRKSPDMQKFLGVEALAHRIVHQASGSFFEALSADADSLDGKNVSFGLIDELHAHRGREVFDAIETGAGKRDQSLMWSITTAGADKTGIAYEQRAYTLNILKGTIEDEAHFGVVYTIDDGDDWTDEAIWRKANPNYGVSVEPDFIAGMCRKAMQSPASQAAFLTKHLNVWIATDQALYDMRAWERCKDETLELDDFEGERCIIAVDLASKTDLAPVLLLFERNGILIPFVRSYLPEAAIEESRNASYRGWQIQGHLTVTDGDVIDLQRIQDDILELATRFEVEAVAYDPWQATQLALNLQANGANVLEYRQTVQNFSEPTKELDARMRSRGIAHDGNPVLAWCLGNIVGHYDAKENVYPKKERPENKIDAGIALIMALGVKLKGEIEPIVTSPWEDEDFKLKVI